MFGKLRALSLLALISLPLVASSQAPGYNKLQDIWVFQSTLLGSWSGGDLVAPNGTIPVDSTQMYNGLPSLSFDVQGPSQWWWQSILAGDSWRPYSIEFYTSNGFLEFDVKGATGGERFNISLSDDNPARLANTSLGTSAVNVGNYVTVSTSWQHVKIPLTDFVAPTDFMFRQLQEVQISESYSGSYAKQFWLNGIKFTSPDTEHNFPAIKVNQVGYKPLGTKYALVTGFAAALPATAGTPFHVIRVSDGKSVYTGKLKLVTQYDEGVSGEEVLEANFTNFLIPGTYLIRVDASGVADSLQFKIGFNVFDGLLRDSLRYYYYQRQGIAIEEPYAEGFTRPLGTPSETAAQFQSGGVTRDVSQGWYDAGDLGKYVADASGVTVTLMDAYSTFPWVFNNGQNNIPESGNGKPDILNEVKWELDWLVKMQDPASGGFYAIVYAGNCVAGVSTCLPDSQTNSYITDVVGGVSNVRPTPETAKAVAALARAADVYRDYDRTLAASYLAAAEAGWAYLEANPQVISSSGLTYGQDTDADERLWAAGELFRTTGKPVYNKYFLANYKNFQAHFTATNGNASDNAFQAFLAYNLSPVADPRERRWFRSQFATWRATQMARLTGAWRNFLPNYYWGSNGVTLGTIQVLVLGDIASGSVPGADLLDAAKSQLNYILGVNPLRHSYVVGVGADSAQTVFAAGLYSPYGVYTPPAGYMGGGPNWYDSPWFSQFQARSFADSNVDWPTNEDAIGYEAPLVFTTAVVANSDLFTVWPVSNR